MPKQNYLSPKNPKKLPKNIAILPENPQALSLSGSNAI
jgi:hypothetical protein